MTGRRTRGAEHNGDACQFRPDRRFHCGGDRGRVSVRHVDCGLRDARRPRTLSGHIQRLGVWPFRRRAGPVQRPESGRGQPPQRRQDRSEPGDRRHRRRSRHADQERHQGAARDPGTDRRGRTRAQRRRGERARARRPKRPTRRHLCRSFAVPDHPRQCGESVREGQFRAGSGPISHRRQFRAPSMR